MVYFTAKCKCKKGGWYEARIFNKGQKYGAPWDGGFNVHIQGEKAYLTLLNKGWNRKADRATVLFLQRKGVKVVIWTHNGIEKVRHLERANKTGCCKKAAA